jgi:hypothetical protein
MKSLNESEQFLNCDVVVINHAYVLNNLSKVVDLVAEYAKKEYFLSVNAEKVAIFWQNMLQKLQTCLLDCQQLRCY